MGNDNVTTVLPEEKKIDNKETQLPGQDGLELKINFDYWLQFYLDAQTLDDKKRFKNERLLPAYKALVEYNDNETYGLKYLPIVSREEYDSIFSDNNGSSKTGSVGTIISKRHSAVVLAAMSLVTKEGVRYEAENRFADNNFFHSLQLCLPPSTPTQCFLPPNKNEKNFTIIEDKDSSHRQIRRAISRLEHQRRLLRDTGEEYSYDGNEEKAAKYSSAAMEAKRIVKAVTRATDRYFYGGAAGADILERYKAKVKKSVSLQENSVLAKHREWGRCVANLCLMVFSGGLFFLYRRYGRPRGSSLWGKTTSEQRVNAMGAAVERLNPGGAQDALRQENRDAGAAGKENKQEESKRGDRGNFSVNTCAF